MRRPVMRAASVRAQADIDSLMSVRPRRPCACVAAGRCFAPIGHGLPLRSLRDFAPVWRVLQSEAWAVPRPIGQHPAARRPCAGLARRPPAPVPRSAASPCRSTLTRMVRSSACLRRGRRGHAAPGGAQQVPVIRVSEVGVRRDRGCSGHRPRAEQHQHFLRAAQALAGAGQVQRDLQFWPSSLYTRGRRWIRSLPMPAITAKPTWQHWPRSDGTIRRHETANSVFTEFRWVHVAACSECIRRS